MVEGLALDKGSSGHSPNPNSGVSASLTLPASPEAAHRLKATTRQSQRERGRLRRRERNSSIFSLGAGGGGVSLGILPITNMPLKPGPLCPSSSLLKI